MNGHGVVIGHFAQEATGSGVCTTMTDPSAVKKLISILIEAEDDTDMEKYDGRKAWIVYSDDVPTSARVIVGLSRSFPACFHASFYADSRASIYPFI